MTYRDKASDASSPLRCLKLQVSFRKRANNYRALLQKMIYRDKASEAFSTPFSGLDWLYWCTGCRKCLGCLISIDHFLQKSPVIIGSFSEGDLQLKAKALIQPAVLRWNFRELSSKLKAQSSKENVSFHWCGKRGVRALSFETALVYMYTIYTYTYIYIMSPQVG